MQHGEREDPADGHGATQPEQHAEDDLGGAHGHESEDQRDCGRGCAS
jgi:hypothetical protein